MSKVEELWTEAVELGFTKEVQIVNSRICVCVRECLSLSFFSLAPVGIEG